jgi:hypothetical protein
MAAAQQVPEVSNHADKHAADESSEEEVDFGLGPPPTSCTLIKEFNLEYFSFLYRAIYDSLNLFREGGKS